MLEARGTIRYNGERTTIEGLLETLSRNADDYEDPDSCTECWASLPVSDIFIKAGEAYADLSINARSSVLQNALNRQLTNADSKFRVEVKADVMNISNSLYMFKLHDVDYAGGESEVDGVLDL